MANFWNRGRSILSERAIRKRSKLPTGRLGSRQSHGLEPLESRCLLAVTATLNGTVLEVSSDSSDDVAVSAVGGDVKVDINGGGAVDPTGGPLAANLLTAINFSGYTGNFNNIVDLTGVSPGDFTALQTVSVDAGDGADQILLGPAITTTGNQTYSENVVLQVNTALNAGAGQIDFGGTVTGAFSLNVATASKTTFRNTVSTTTATTGSADVEVNLASGTNVVLLQDLIGSPQLQINGTTLISLTAVNTFTFEGGSGDDQLAVDGSAGNPFPPGGITFNGNGQTSTDSLFVSGDTTNSAVYTPDTTTAGDGMLTVDGTPIVFTGLEPVDISGMANILISTSNAGSILTVTDGFDFGTGVIPALLVAGTSGGVAIETAALWNNTTVTVDTTVVPGSDDVTINSVSPAHLNTNLIVNTGAGTDDVNIINTSLATTLNGGTENDTFVVTPSPIAVINVNGDPPVFGDPDVPPGDVLALNLLGVIGALVPPSGIPDGVITSVNRQNVFFTSIETLIASDRFEPNNTLATATVLGSEPEITLRDLSIHDQDDEDFYKITANKTGKLIINAFFTHAVGDLDIQVQDMNGNVIANSATATDDEQIIIPVVSQEMYFLRVFGLNDDVNNYELEIENFAVPAPAAVYLDPASDTGMMNNDNITNDVTPQFFVLADLSDFANMGITILTAAQAAGGVTAGAAVRVFVTNLNTGVTVEGYADPVGASNTLFAFEPAALADGTYFVTAAVDIFDLQEDGGGLPDPAMGRSLLSPPLTVTIDATPPDPSTIPDLLAASDSGVFDNDDVTNINAPAFQGVGPANHKIRILASRDGGPLELIGQGVIGSDLTDAPEPNGLGAWEITVEPLTDGAYDVVAIVEDAAGNQSELTEPLTVYIDRIAPNTPVLDLIEASDSGRNDTDNITNDNTPTVITTADDPFVTGSNPFPNDILYRIFDRLSPNVEVLLVDSFVNLGGLTTDAVFSDVLPLLADGVHNLKLEVEDRAGNLSHDFLLTVVIDTVAPPIPTLTLDPASDTGIPGQPLTFADLLTSDTTPAFLGLSEANTLVRVYGDGAPISDMLINATDTFLGETVAIPLDGNQAFPDGQWILTNLLFDLNDPTQFPFDGLRQIAATAEDVAGNLSEDGAFLDIFIDTQAPKVADVGLTDYPAFDLFDPKPSEDGPTPPVTSIEIDFVDLPVRALPNGIPDLFTNYPAVNEQLATTIGNYELIGDHNGVIPIASIQFIDNTAPGNPGMTSVRLFFDEPLPDDRYTLRVRDSISDEPGNALDGESGVNAPSDNPVFPSGDGSPGGDFVARFTIDSRPEIITYSDGSVYSDANGNFYFDTTNADFSNRDLVFQYGFATDALFVGNFNNQGFAADGFDKLGAYGFVNGAWRWILDTDNDGVANLNLINPLAIDGLPVAGNFNGIAVDGDEVGLFDGNTWFLDTNANDVIDPADVQLLNSNMVGYPIVGDFDGDGVDDLGTYANNVFQFDLAFDGLDGQVDDTINFGFSGVLDRPVAGDYNLDGIDDIGLWVPGRSGQLPERAAEWYFLLSETPNEALPEAAEVVALQFGTVNALDHPFSPQPLGNDIFAQFGDEFALPLFGNLDPPATGTTSSIGSLKSTVGVFDPSTASVYLRSENSSGVPDAGHYNYGVPGWTAITGDFNGDGKETVGVYNSSTATFFLNNAATSFADIPAFNYGMPGWTPIVGDWDGDGIDTVGVYNPATATFFLRNSNTTGVADVPAFNYGAAGWDPLVGDWNGDNIDTIGVFNPATATFFLRNSNTTGIADLPAFNYGGSGWTPLAGDWNSDGVDSIGVYDGASSSFFLRNSNSSGAPDVPVFSYGPAGGGWQPLIGDWNGLNGSPLRLEGSAVRNSDADKLTDSELDSVVVQAIANWTTVGLNSQQISTLGGIDFIIADLPGNYLGLALDDLIYLDIDAAGLGWHVDPSDSDVGGVDLISVVAHELGHTLGLDDLYSPEHRDELMAGTISPGERRVPDADDLLFGEDDWL